MASEESDSEIEVAQENNSEAEAEVEEQQNDQSTENKDTVEAENTEENIEESPEDKTEESQVTEEPAVEENTQDNAAEQEEEEVSPPPPPTSGDLIGLIEPPTFPKDLVGSRSEGTVRLMVQLSPGGAVNNIDVIESSGYESMDRVAQLTLEHGWEFKEYQRPYRIPVSVRYYIDESDNSQVDVEIGEVEFVSGGE